VRTSMSPMRRRCWSVFGRTPCAHMQVLWLRRAIAQAVSRWLPTAAARVRARVWSSGICGGQSGAGAGFLRVLRFPLPIFIPPTSPSSYSPVAGTIGHSVADVPSGSIWTPPPTMRINKKKFCDCTHIRDTTSRNLSAMNHPKSHEQIIHNI
jgi:hypothetical protein